MCIRDSFLIVGVANAVNLTDGLDGLAGGTSAVAFLAYGVIALAQQQSYVAAFCFTVAGAVLGFLWYNVNPAQVFMGDVGALGLGAALATVASVSYTHLRAHETVLDLVCRLLLEKKKKPTTRL